MADKYLQRTNTGEVQEKLSVEESSGAVDAGKLVALDSSGRLTNSVMPDGTGSEQITAVATEAIPAGSVVNLWDNGGVLSARLANAATRLRAIGFVTETKSSGQTITVLIEGSVTGLSSIVPATPYYLSATVPGAFTATAPNTPGHISQEIGVGVTTTSVTFEPATPIKIA